jgi:tetratricopeptide (TPR) repeat protein
VEGEYGDLLLAVRDLLAQIRTDQGRLAEAEALIRSNLEARRNGERSVEHKIATGLLQHGQLLRAKGDREAAAGLFREALEIRERLFDEESAPVAGALNDLGAVLAEMGRFDEAEPVQRRALSVLRARLGEGHVNTVTAAHNLAWMLLTKKKSPADALAVIEPYEKPARDQLGERHSMSIRVTQVMGRSLAALGRHAEAIAPLTDAARRSEHLGADGLAIDAIASRAAAECYGSLGDSAAQAEWKARGEDRLKRAREKQGN